ncbi:MAG: histidine kinase [Undibacterium sp.]|nr:histidine kinase [Undibacterium sp.]
MWRIYSIGWIAYSILISVILQLSDLTKGKFDLTYATQSLVSQIPAALILYCIWPLAGWLERRQTPTWKLILIHISSALAFAISWHLFSFVLMAKIFDFSANRPLSWYVWPFMYSMLLYGVIAGIFHGLRASEAKRVQALAASHAQALLVTAELSALRNKLNPHFLFNTLHSIIALVRKDANAAETALFRFSDMLRYILQTEKSGNDRVTLENEIDFVRDYLDLEALRLGHRLQVHWKIAPESLSCCLPALSIQPLVENSIKHAFNPRSQPGNLTIQTSVDEHKNQLEILIKDDGPGCNLHQLGQIDGLGIRTIERRLQLEYGAKSSFQIESQLGQGYAVQIRLPLT